LCPELKVVGVAGPGDPLASHHALDALSRIKGEYPDLISCLSTNGLMLPENMERMLLSGVEALTVTVNSVDPRILSHINRFVLYKGSLIEGIEAQEILIDAQMRGIKLARENAMIVKINTVLIPGVNDGHVPEIARKVKEWGAEILNIIPLIPAGELSHLSPPSSDDYRRASQSAERELPVKMNCRRCRADACGVPGVSDYSREIYGEITFEETFSHG
ncbi:MAG: radical SAM protein, partial [Deltaproteobacteria bacterium]|nr:radical SAM protein [Deltaproteobacteria bacterium]